jgi:hypothetical protein
MNTSSEGSLSKSSETFESIQDESHADTGRKLINDVSEDESEK